MSESIDFIKDRATKSISAAKELAASWTWQEKSPDQMQAALTAITGNSSATPPVVGQEEIVSQKEQVMLAARGGWDGNLDQLHRWTVQGVGMSKNRFRNDPAKSGQLANLSARGTSRTETLKEALAWESAWGNVDPSWAPLPANTLPAFKALRKQCAEDLQSVYSDTQSVWSAESKKLSQMAADLEDVNVAWYADATRVFAAGTPEGDMLRANIPTTYNPPPPNPASPPPAPNAPKP